MDIKKEREAFEEHLAGMNIHNLRVGTIFDIEKNEYFASDVLHPSEDHIVGWINFSWKLWQEKATPEGFVLVPKDIISVLEELTQFSSYAEIVGGISVNRAAIREQCDIAFTLIREFEDTESLKEIEAQEQSHELD